MFCSGFPYVLFSSWLAMFHDGDVKSIRFQFTVRVLSSISMALMFSVANPTISIAASRESQSVAVICPGGGVYLVDRSGNAWNGQTCSGALTLSSSVVNIDPDAFKNSQITSVTFNYNLMTIQAGAFENTRITKVNFPANLYSIGSHAFYGLPLTAVTLNSSLTIIGAEAFHNSMLWCLTNNSGASLAGTGLEGFSSAPRCDSAGDYPSLANRFFAQVPCPGGGEYWIQGDGVVTNGQSCSGNLILDNRVKYISWGAFYNNNSGTGLTSLVMNSNLKVISDYAFNDSTLHSITFNNNLSWIGDAAFTRSDAPQLVLNSNLEHIGNFAFSSLTATSLILPSSLTYIGNYAFLYVPLTSLTLSIDQVKINASVNYPYYIGINAFGGNGVGASLQCFTNPTLLSLSFTGLQPFIGIQACDSAGLVPIAVPTVSVSPGNSSINVGNPVTLTATASTSDGGILSYQWRFEGSAIVGANSAIYTFTPTSRSQAGEYSVLVTSSLRGQSNNSSASSTISIGRGNQSIDFTISPSSASSSNGGYSASITPTVTNPGSGSGAFAYAVSGGTATGCTISSPSTIGTLTASSSGTCQITATKQQDANYLQATATKSFTFERSTPNSLVITSTSGVFGTDLTLTSSGGSTGGSTSYNTSTTGCSITSGVLQTNLATTCVVTATRTADVFTGESTSAATNVVISRSPLIPPTITGVTAANTTQLTVTFTNSANTTSTNAYLYSASTGGSALQSLTNQSSGFSFTNLNPSTTYYISLLAVGTGNYTNSAESARVSGVTRSNAVAPTVTVSPSNSSIAVGKEVSITAAASASDGGVLSYTWSTGGKVIQGATTATYTFTPIKTSESGQYVVTVTNTLNATSETATASALVVVSGPLSVLTPTTGLVGTYNTFFSLPLSFGGGESPLTIALTSGTLPTGLAFDTSTGLISGTPRSPGTFPLTVTVTDHINQSVTAAFQLQIFRASQTIAFTLSPNSYATSTTFSSPVTPTLTNAGLGSGAVTYSISGGTATGCAISSPSRIETISATSVGKCEIQASKASDTNYLEASATASFTFSMSSAPQIVPTPTPAPTPPPPPQAYMTAGTVPTIHKVDSTVKCTAGTFNYGIRYFDGTPDYYQSNSSVSSLTYSFLINGIVQSALTTVTLSSWVSLPISNLPSVGLLTCQVTGTRGGVSVSAATTSNESGFNAALLQQSNAVATAASIYQSALKANLTKEKSALAENRTKWRANVSAAQSNFAQSARKSPDAKAQSVAIRLATDAYKAEARIIANQLLTDNANVLKVHNTAITKAADTYNLALEGAGYGVMLG
jgi:hypothetical protein